MLKEPSTALRLSLDLREDILCLYTPYSEPGRRIEHTRSALIQRKSETETVFTIVASMTFNLVISVPTALPICKFLRFLILSYVRHAYDDYSQQNDFKEHAALNGLSNEARAYLYRVDKQNRENYQLCKNKHVFDDAPDTEDGRSGKPWTWYKAGDERILDMPYRYMRNINFIREVTEIDIHNEDPSFQQEGQYKIQLDNHVILLHLLQKLRYGQITIPQNELKLKFNIKLLDPVCSVHSRYELFKGHDYLGSYVEKQLDVKRNHCFVETLYFPASYTCTGGLVMPSLSVKVGGEKQQAPIMMNHTIEQMFVLASSARKMIEEEVWDQLNEDTGLGMMQPDKIKKVKKVKTEEFKIRHNPLYILLSGEKHTHVQYFEATKTVLRHDLTPLKKAKKVEESAASTPRAAVKEPRFKDTKQPLLRTFVATIPEDSKRKYEQEPPTIIISHPSEDEARPLKKQCLSKKTQQPTLQQFFK